MGKSRYLMVNGPVGLVLGLAAAGWMTAAPAQQDDEYYDSIPVGEEESRDAEVGKRQGDRKRGIVEEIVVTARKREETMQDVPLSITPFTAGEIEQRGFSGLEDIAAATPGFTFEPFMTGGAHGNAVIRGLAQQFTTARIQNVSFFLDGVYLQRQSMLDLGMIDMERIEVVKGPQNALYGRNAFAGAVNYITLRPRAEREAYLALGLGDNQRRELRFSWAGPLGATNTWFGKFTGGVKEYDGHTKNDHPVADADPPGPNLRGNLGGYDDSTWSLSLAFEPSNELRVRTSYYRSDLLHETFPGFSISGVNAARFLLRFDDQNDLNCNVATVQNIGDPSKSHTGFSAWCGELPSYASDVAERRVPGMVVDPRAIGTITTTDAITFSTEYRFNDALSLHYLFGYADHQSYTDGGASDEDPVNGRNFLMNAGLTTANTQVEEAYEQANTASGRPNSVLESFSHELRFDWAFNDRMSFSFGGYFASVTDQEWTTLFIPDLCNADSAINRQNCSEPIYQPSTLPERTELTVGVSYDQYFRQHGGDRGGVRGEWTEFNDTISAIFGAVNYWFSDKLEGTLETRFSIEDKVVDRFTDSFGLRFGESVMYSQPEDPVIPGLGDTVESMLVVPHDERSFSYFTPRAILNWHWADNKTLYGSIAKGVKAGGFNNAETVSELTYDEAENWTFEVGSKNRLFHFLTLNGAIYYIDWTGLQGGVPPAEASISSSDIITNIGGASSFGIEIEADAFLTEHISADLGLTLNNPTYDDGVKYSAGDFENGSIHCDGVTCPSDGDVSGNQLARTSKVQASLGFNYFRNIGGWNLSARIDTSYQTKQFVTPLNLAWVPDRQLTNLSFSFVSPNEVWELGSWVKNLTDEDYASNSFFIGVFNQYMVGKGPRRQFGANLKYNF